MNSDRLYYDDDCPICRRAVQRLRRKGLDAALQVVPIGRSDTKTARDLPDKDKLKEEIHLMTADGRIFRGASALIQLYKRQGRAWLPVQLYSLPPVRRVFDSLYRLIARNRHWLAKKMGWE